MAALSAACGSLRTWRSAQAQTTWHRILERCRREIAATASEPLFLVLQVAQTTAAAGSGSLPAAARGGIRGRSGHSGIPRNHPWLPTRMPPGACRCHVLNGHVPCLGSALRIQADAQSARNRTDDRGYPARYSGSPGGAASSACSGSAAAGLSESSCSTATGVATDASTGAGLLDNAYRTTATKTVRIMPTSATSNATIHVRNRSRALLPWILALVSVNLALVSSLGEIGVESRDHVPASHVLQPLDSIVRLARINSQTGQNVHQRLAVWIVRGCN